jgi:hypothetical protein
MSLTLLKGFTSTQLYNLPALKTDLLRHGKAFRLNNNQSKTLIWGTH